MSDMTNKCDKCVFTYDCKGINCPQYTYRCIAYGEPSIGCPLFRQIPEGEKPITTKKSIIEELKEGIDTLIKKNTVFFEGIYSPLAGPITSDRREMWCKTSYLADKLLQYLASTGKVYIKDDDQKLPKIYDSENDHFFSLPDWCNDAYKRDGWIKAKPLKDVL